MGVEKNETAASGFPQLDRKWFAIWILIYGTFLVGDFVAPGVWQVTMLKLLGLFLCLVYAWQKFHQDHLLVLALAFTLLSDVILALDNVNSWGIFTFLFAHFFHMARLADTPPTALIPYVVFVVLTFTFGVMTGTPPIFVLGLVYAVALFSNIYLSWHWWHSAPKKSRAKYAFFGFLLFLACDIAVVCSYLSLIGQLPYLFYMPANYLAWVFYYPAQILISNSSKTVIK